MSKAKDNVVVDVVEVRMLFEQDVVATWLGEHGDRSDLAPEEALCEQVADWLKSFGLVKRGNFALFQSFKSQVSMSREALAEMRGEQN